jgi:hypothetical protein
MERREWEEFAEVQRHIAAMPETAPVAEDE